MFTSLILTLWPVSNKFDKGGRNKNNLVPTNAGGNLPLIAPVTATSEGKAERFLSLLIPFDLYNGIEKRSGAVWSALSLCMKMNKLKVNLKVGFGQYCSEI